MFIALLKYTVLNDRRLSLPFFQFYRYFTLHSRLYCSNWFVTKEFNILVVQLVPFFFFFTVFKCQLKNTLEKLVCSSEGCA